jgi:hypothetical protein
LGLAPGRSAPGVLFHWAAATDDGVRAVDVYESREAADRLVQDTIGPIAGGLGLPLPDITEFEVHNLLTPWPGPRTKGQVSRLAEMMPAPARLGGADLPRFVVQATISRSRGCRLG